MEPLPETAEALSELESDDDAGVRLRRLQELAERARAVVPALVGVSLGYLEQELTFTLVASDAEFALLDGVQYVDGGPCVEAAHARDVREFTAEDLLDETRWQLFAEATAAHDIKSTLTLPVLRDDRIVGTVNLYASTRDAFVGHHHDLAEIFDGWAAGAISNADLTFATRGQAAATPDRVRERTWIEAAAATIAFRRGIELEEAEILLRDAADRAQVSPAELARQIMEAHQDEQDEDDETEPPT